jgi:hypothetical protein
VRPHVLAPGLWAWSAPHPDWTPDRAGVGGWDRDVWSWLLEAEDRVVLIDPLLPADPDLTRWLDERVDGRPVDALVSVYWHLRSADAMHARYDATVWGNPKTREHRFPIFERRVYINSCSQGALSDAVRESYEQYLADWDERGAPWEYWVERQEAARASVRGLVNAEPDEIAVTTSLSAGVSALASGLASRAARRSCSPTGSSRRSARSGTRRSARRARRARPPTDGTIPLEHFERAIDDDTLLVSITHVCYRNGAMARREEDRRARARARRARACSTRTSRSARCRST